MCDFTNTGDIQVIASTQYIGIIIQNSQEMKGTRWRECEWNANANVNEMKGNAIEI
jgi:hypothetical protein